MNFEEAFAEIASACREHGLWANDAIAPWVLLGPSGVRAQGAVPFGQSSLGAALLWGKIAPVCV